MIDIDWLIIKDFDNGINIRNLTKKYNVSSSYIKYVILNKGDVEIINKMINKRKDIIIKNELFDKFLDLYNSNINLKDIAKQLYLTKNTVISTISNKQMKLRNVDKQKIDELNKKLFNISSIVNELFLPYNLIDNYLNSKNNNSNTKIKINPYFLKRGKISDAYIRFY
jgi:Mor family transcriptional regulator